MNGLIRGFVYLTVVTSLTAIGVHRLAPRASHFRILKRNNLVPVNGYHFQDFDRLPRLFNPETGALESVTLEGADTFDSATCSPWEDDQGHSEVVGRWLGRSEGEGNCNGYGLARYRFPGGEALERVKLTILPTSRPCFDPERRGTVLFTGGDGGLYRYVFDGKNMGDGEVSPTRLKWNVRTAGEAPIGLNDPIWPTDPRLKGRLIVSLTYMNRNPTGALVMKSFLGWLRLNAAGTEVVQAGRLIAPDARTADAESLPQETLPILYETPDGAGLTLAFLSHGVQERGWTMNVAPIDVDCETGIPRVDSLRIRSLATNRSHTIPLFSADGQTLYSLVYAEPKPQFLESVAVPSLVGTPHESLARHDSRNGRLERN